MQNEFFWGISAVSVVLIVFSFVLMFRRRGLVVSRRTTILVPLLLIIIIPAVVKHLKAELSIYTLMLLLFFLFVLFILYFRDLKNQYLIFNVNIDWIVASFQEMSKEEGLEINPEENPVIFTDLLMFNYRKKMQYGELILNDHYRENVQEKNELIQLLNRQRHHGMILFPVLLMFCGLLAAAYSVLMFLSV